MQAFVFPLREHATFIKVVVGPFRIRILPFWVKFKPDVLLNLATISTSRSPPHTSFLGFLFNPSGFFPLLPPQSSSFISKVESFSTIDHPIAFSFSLLLPFAIISFLLILLHQGGVFYRSRMKWYQFLPRSFFRLSWEY